MENISISGMVSGINANDVTKQLADLQFSRIDTYKMKNEIHNKDIDYIKQSKELYANFKTKVDDISSIGNDKEKVKELLEDYNKFQDLEHSNSREARTFKRKFNDLFGQHIKNDDMVKMGVSTDRYTGKVKLNENLFNKTSQSEIDSTLNDVKGNLTIAYIKHNSIVDGIFKSTENTLTSSIKRNEKLIDTMQERKEVYQEQLKNQFDKMETNMMNSQSSFTNIASYMGQNLDTRG